MLKFDNLHMTQREKIIVGFMANVDNVFIKRLQTFFNFFLTFLKSFFSNLYLSVYDMCGLLCYILACVLCYVE